MIYVNMIFFINSNNNKNNNDNDTFLIYVIFIK